MTIETAVRRIQSCIVKEGNKLRPIPDDRFEALCDAMWNAGQHPRIQTLRKYLPNLGEPVIAKGFHAWRRSRGLHAHYPRWANPNVGGPAVLARLVPPQIAVAPMTFFDKHNDGRWHAPHPRVVTYLASIQNTSLRHVLALYALIKADLGDSLYHRVVQPAVLLTKLMREERLASVYEIDPDDLILRVCEGTAVSSLNAYQRSFSVLAWNNVTNAFHAYAERLNDADRASMSKFFLKPLRKRYRMRWSRPAVVVRDLSREKVKAKTDVVHPQFHTLRFMAKIRCNQAQRLYEAVSAAIAAVTGEHVPLPYAFSYEETVAAATGKPIRQRVLMTLWDSTALWKHAIEKGHPGSVRVDRLRRQQAGRFAPDRRQFFVQYRGTEAMGNRRVTAPFWFLELYDHQVFSGGKTPGTKDQQVAFFKEHGYSSQKHWAHTPGLLRPLRRHVNGDAAYLEREHGYRFLHYEGIYAACLFAHMVVRMQTITGARLGEVQQVAQNPDCIQHLVNVGPKGASRWVLRMIPKGRKERADYFIDSDTKDVLMEVLRFQRQILGLKKLPVVPHQLSRYGSDRYLLQWNGIALNQHTLNTVLRFLLHAAVLDSNGACVHLTSHVLRHGFATEMASQNVPVEVIAKILHQRHLEVTQYYSKPTKQQVIEAAELMFVERIDIAAEALRSPDEIGKMLRDAEGQVGALTEVVGGTCVVSNMCPVKFACIGCAGNAPDPERRYQIEAKRTWAVQQISWARREKLVAEERQMNRVIQDCDLILEEMTLMERARADGGQKVVVDRDRKDAKTKTKGS